MFGWTILVSALLLVEFGVANPVNESSEHLSKERIELKTQLENLLVDNEKYTIKEVRALVQIVLEDPKATEKFTDVIKEYEDFLVKTKDYETVPKVELAKYFQDAIGFITNPEILKPDDLSKNILLQKYEAYIATYDDMKLVYLKFVEKFGHKVRDYLDKLTENEKKMEVQLVFWYDLWTHQKDIFARWNLTPELFKLFAQPTQSLELYAYMLSYSFGMYVYEIKGIIAGVDEEKFVNEINAVIKFYTSGNFNTFSEMAKLYGEFSEWLLTKGPAYFMYKRAAIISTVRFFDSVDFYTELFLRYSDDVHGVRDWYKDLKESEHFKESFDKYFKLFPMIYSRTKELRIKVPM